ncbi:MAG: thioredoxin family protein [Deltaproteobacteria bacterium]|jgi:thioredoxin-related protein|nr:thioredoxin family protein [Deltaproteobacteria bacterium]
MTLVWPFKALAIEETPPQDQAAPSVMETQVSQLSFDEALTRAQAENKYVIAYFWTDWCPNCANFNQYVLNDPDIVSAMNRDFFFVPVDADHERQLSVEFMVRVVPTTIFLSPDGQPASILPGTVNAEVFMLVLNYISSGAYIDLEFEDFAKTAISQARPKVPRTGKADGFLFAALKYLTPGTIEQGLVTSLISLNFTVKLFTPAPITLSLLTIVDMVPLENLAKRL